jgi:hypothetical protein
MMRKVLQADMQMSWSSHILLAMESLLPILLIGFPDTCFLTYLEIIMMSFFTVWLVSDFVSTPFALKQQL